MLEMVETRAQKRRRQDQSSKKTAGEETVQGKHSEHETKKRQGQKKQIRHNQNNKGSYEPDTPTKASELKKESQKHSAVGGGRGESATGKEALPRKRHEKEMEAEKEPKGDRSHTIKINRAPVLTLWAAIVAEREGNSFEEGLTFGRWIAGVMAQSKGRSLGIYEAKERSPEEIQKRKEEEEAMGVKRIHSFGMKIPTLEEQYGRRKVHFAMTGGTTIDPQSTLRYLKKSFHGDDNLEAAIEAMKILAESIPAERIGSSAYHLYERFRPEWRGWGQPSVLDLNYIRTMSEDENR